MAVVAIAKKNMYIRQVGQFIAPNEDDVPIPVF